MLINEMNVYDNRKDFLKIANLLVSDETSHKFDCNVSIDHKAMYVASWEYDIVVKYRDELYVINVYDNINYKKHQFISCDYTRVAKLIRNLHMFNKFYAYANMYAYLLNDSDYEVTLSFDGTDYIDIHIMNVDTFKIVATMEIRRTTDSFFRYRYFGSNIERPIGSPSKLIHEFFKRWA